MHQLHDHLFKLVMQTKSEARRFLLHFVHPQLSKRLDLDSLVLLPDTIVDKNLAQYYTDVSYSCETKGGKKTQVCFLFEHKSYPDRNILLQILYYKVSQYWKQINEKETPKLVIPIILVHGKRNFKVTPLTQIFGLEETIFARYLPSFTYEYVNVNELQTSDLEPIRATYLISMLLAFKGNGDKQQLLTSIAEIFKFVQAHEDDKLEEVFVRAIMTYVVTIYNLKQEDMNDIQAEIPQLMMPHLRDAGYNIWHEGHDEGFEKGKGIGEKVKETSSKLEFVVNLLCDAPAITDEAKAGLASVETKFIAKVRKTFTRRSIKKRKEEFRSFYKKIEGLEADNYHKIDELFEQLRKKIKSSKTKITAKEKKKK